MRPVAAFQRGQRLGEWRTDSEGWCTYHSDGRRTVTVASMVSYVIAHLAPRSSALARINQAYDAQFSGKAIRIHTPKH